MQSVPGLLASIVDMRRVPPYSFHSVHTAKALPDVFSYNGIRTQDMLLALALQTQVIPLIVLQIQRKSDGF